MAEFEHDITTLYRYHWTDHIDTMDQLRQGIHLRSYATKIHFVIIKMKVMSYLI